MVKITYLDHAGEGHTIEATSGKSLMKNAVRNRVKGIVGECGGNTRCGTCRIYLSAEWLEKLEPPRDDEQEMIDFTGDANPGVRLSCQIVVSEAMDGMELRMPLNPYPEA